MQQYDEASRLLLPFFLSKKLYPNGKQKGEKRLYVFEECFAEKIARVSDL